MITVTGGKCSLDDALEGRAGTQIDFESGHAIHAQDGHLLLKPPHNARVARRIGTHTQRVHVREIEVLPSAQEALRERDAHHAQRATNHGHARAWPGEHARKVVDWDNTEADDIDEVDPGDADKADADVFEVLQVERGLAL